MAGHRFALGNTWGRPPVYEHVEELAAKILEYFDYCEGEFHEEEQPVSKKGKDTGEVRKVKVWDRYPEKKTITGMCLFLGFESRASFDNQGKRSDEFLYIVKRAKMIVENVYEERLTCDIPGTATGAIFALKNMGWSDKTEIDHTSGGEKLTPQVIKWGDKEISV